MWKIRFAKLSDLQQLKKITKFAGTGMTSFPSTAKAWKHKLIEVQETVNGTHDHGTYLMVLEKDGIIIGTAGVYTNVGQYRPFFLLNTETLKYEQAFTGTAEVGSLFLMKKARQPGLGHVLAQSRYMLMKQFPDLFPKTVIACCRGNVAPNGTCEFWEEIVEPYVFVQFKCALHRTAEEGNQWLSELVPSVFELTDKQKDLLFAAHKDTLPAIALLEKERFIRSVYVDLLDGGPVFYSNLKEVKCYSKIQLGMLQTEHFRLESNIPRSMADFEITITPNK